MKAQLLCCPDCGTAAYPEDRFCSRCGGELPPHCHRCGAEVRHPVAYHCTGCGGLLEQVGRKLGAEE